MSVNVTSNRVIWKVVKKIIIICMRVSQFAHYLHFWLIMVFLLMEFVVVVVCVCMGGLAWLQGGVSQPGRRVGSIDQRWSQREREHFFGVSQWGGRLGALPAGLTVLSRNVCDWRPGWGCVLSYSMEANQLDWPTGLTSVPSAQRVCFLFLPRSRTIKWN